MVPLFEKGGYMTTYNDLSASTKRRLKALAICPVCSKPISDIQAIEYVSFQNGKWKSYVFFHSECLRNFVKEGYNGELETEQR